MRTCRSATLTLLPTLVLGACVTSRTYDRKVAEFETFKREEAARTRVARAEIQALESETNLQAQRVQHLEASLGDRSTDLEETRRQLQGSGTQIDGLKKRVDQLGQDLSRASDERGQLNATLGVTRARLLELRSHALVTEARAQLFRDLVQKLHAMIDAGKLKVTVREGRMLIALPSDVLFDSGRTNVKQDAQGTLREVAVAVREIHDRKFLVVGHTDDVPIHTARFASNWELSAGRAIAVAHVLMSEGLLPRNLGIAGQAEFDPVVANDSAEHRRLNRRIEIVLEPNVQELPQLPADPAVSLQ